MRNHIAECLVGWLIEHGTAPVHPDEVTQYGKLSRKAKSYCYNKRLILKRQSIYIHMPNGAARFEPESIRITERGVDWLQKEKARLDEKRSRS